jgi:hypothetical protein
MAGVDAKSKLASYPRGLAMGAENGVCRRGAKSHRVGAGEEFDAGGAEFAGAIDYVSNRLDEEAGANALVREAMQNGT